MKQKVYQFNTELYKLTGIQKVMLDIHEALKEDWESKIIGTIPYDKLDSNLHLDKNTYIRFRHPYQLRNSIIIIHERRLLPIFWLISHFPFINLKYVYLHHSKAFGRKKLSLFPPNVITISEDGKNNLVEYFGLNISRITKIYNCVRDCDKVEDVKYQYNPSKITVLYPARINGNKRQLEIVTNLRGKLDSRVKIHFAGIGPKYEELKALCKGDKQFKVLGFIDDINDLMRESDYVLLYSSHEGLPISLIEASLNGVPAICNDVGGNTEIVSDGENGIIVDDWDSLLKTLNGLPDFSEKTVIKMRSNARQRYKDKFTFEIFKKKYNNLIRKINDNR